MHVIEPPSSLIPRPTSPRGSSPTALTVQRCYTSLISVGWIRAFHRRGMNQRAGMGRAEACAPMATCSGTTTANTAATGCTWRSVWRVAAGRVRGESNMRGLARHGGTCQEVEEPRKKRTGRTRQSDSDFRLALQPMKSISNRPISKPAMPHRLEYKLVDPLSVLHKHGLRVRLGVATELEGDSDA